VTFLTVTMLSTSLFFILFTKVIIKDEYQPTNIITYLLHGAEFLFKANWFLQLVKKFPAFLEPEGSSPHPQVPATCPYLEPTSSSPHNCLPLPEDPS